MNRSIRIARVSWRMTVIAIVAGLTAVSCYETTRPTAEDDAEIDLSALKRFEPAIPEPRAVREQPREEDLSTAQPTAISTPQTEAPARAGTIAIGDILEVTVVGLEKMNGKFRVDHRGNVEVPLLGTVKAAGRSVWSVKSELADRLAARTENPEVHLVLVRQPVAKSR